MPKYFYWTGTVTLITLIVFLLAITDHITNTATNSNTVSFSGEGKVFAVPDVAAVSFSIVTEAITSKAAQDENSKKSQKIVDFLKSQNIDEKDIKTTGYNIYPKYNYPNRFDPQDQEIVGYTAKQTFQVKIRDLDKVSGVLDGLVLAGANQVNNLGFQIDDEEKLKDEARELAIEDAKEKANKLKKQIGIKLGKIVNYSEGDGYPYPYRLEVQSFDGGIGGGGPSVPVGENEIIVNVTIMYQIK